MTTRPLLRPLESGALLAGRATRGLMRDAPQACPATAAAIDSADVLVTHEEALVTPADTPPASPTLGVRAKAAATTPIEARAVTLQPMESLPGPPAWPVVGNFLTYLKKENVGQMHKVQSSYHEKYGPIFREKWGMKWQVHIADPDLAAVVYRNQGRYPIRPSIASWNLYREVTNRPLGLLTSKGPEWGTTRSYLDKRLLCPHAAAGFLKPVHDVTEDFIAHIRRVRDAGGDVALAENFTNQAYHWGVECAGAVLLEHRFGCLWPDMPTIAQQYISAIQVMMESSLQLIVGERIHQRLNTPFWRRHKEAWDTIMEIGEQLIQNRSQAMGTTDAKDTAKGGLLTTLLRGDHMTVDEINSNTAEMLLAASDTTSNALCFTLSLLAKHPEVQHRLQEECLQKAEADLTNADLDGMRYLHAVLKETFRLYPGATMQVRVLDEDIALRGHRVPKGTMIVINHYTMSHDANLFADPETFDPDRWLRDESQRLQHHPFASLPFGFGRRRCIGQRIARLELAMALYKILRNFTLEPVEGLEMKPTLRTILCPGSTIPIRFVER